MKHIRNKTVLAMTAAVALLLCGCTKELPNEGIGEGTYLSLSIDGQQAPSSSAAYASAAESAARQGAATRAVSVNEVIVNNVWVLQFKMTSATEGKLVKKEYFSSVPSTNKIKYAPEAGTNMALYLVANTNAPALFTQTAIDATLASVKAKTLTISTSAGNNFPTDATNNLLMVGQSTNLTLPTTAVPVRLTRTMAKVILTVKNGLTTGYPQLTVTSTQLKNVPTIYSTQVVNSASGFTGTTYYPATGASNFTSYTAVSGNVTAAGTTTTYYVAPNVRGISTNSDDRLKGPDTAPSGQGAYCTYVEIMGTAKATASSPAVDVRYRLYLGGNNTNNFNIYSNTAYKVGIELTGLSPADARLTITTDKFDLVQGGIDGDQEDDIVDWDRPFIGELRDNGIVYWVDSNDPTKYKVVSVKEWASIKWATNDRNDVKANSDADGKTNTAAIKTYFESNTATLGTDFTVAFPAVAECYNYQGKDGSDPIGTWYLPAKHELQYLWCAFNGKAPIGWDYNTHSDAPKDDAVQKVFNKYLTDAGGTPITTSANNGGLGAGFWASTQSNVGFAYTMCIHFEDSKTVNADKMSKYFIRCIRGN